MQLLERLLVPAEIALAANEDDGQARAEVEDLRDPLELTISSFPVQARARLNEPSPGRYPESLASPRRSRSG